MIAKLNCVAVRRTFSHEFEAKKLGDLKVGRMAKLDRAISMDFAEQKTFEKSTLGVNFSYIFRSAKFIVIALSKKFISPFAIRPTLSQLFVVQKLDDKANRRKSLMRN